MSTNKSNFNYDDYDSFEDYDIGTDYTQAVNHDYSFDYGMQFERPKIEVFTDGACSGNPGFGGWASVFVMNDNYEDEEIDVLKGHAEDTTNNRMELQAIISAMHHILDRIEYDTSLSIDTEFVIYSDSSYCIDSINLKRVETWKKKGWTLSSGKPTKNKDLWESFIFYKKRLDAQDRYPRFERVKGHAGIEGNELADGLAKSQVLEAKELKKKKTRYY